MQPMLVVGTKVSVPFLFGFCEHVGFVSGYYANGEPAVISISASKGFVQEPLSSFAGGHQWVSGGRPLDLSPAWILYRAFSVAHRPYNLFSWNCEHLVAYAYGQEVRSPQIAAVSAAVFGAIAVALVAKA